MTLMTLLKTLMAKFRLRQRKRKSLNEQLCWQECIPVKCVPTAVCQFRRGSLSGREVSIRRGVSVRRGFLSRGETPVDIQTTVKTLLSLAGGNNSLALKLFLPVCSVLSQSTGRYSYSCLWVALLKFKNFWYIINLILSKKFLSPTKTIIRHDSNKCNY